MPITYATTMYSFNCRFTTCHLFIGPYLCTPYVLGPWIRAPATHFYGARILTTLSVLFILRPLAPCRNICLPLLCHYTVLPVPNSTGPYLGHLSSGRAVTRNHFLRSTIVEISGARLHQQAQGSDSTCKSIVYNNKIYCCRQSS